MLIFIHFHGFGVNFHAFSWIFLSRLCHLCHLCHLSHLCHLCHLCDLYPPYCMSATENLHFHSEYFRRILRFCSLTNVSEHTHVVSSLLCHLCDTGPDPTADPNLSRADPGPDPDLFLLTPLWCQWGNPRSQLFFVICCRSRRSFIFFWFSMKSHCGSTVVSKYCFHSNSSIQWTEHRIGTNIV